METELNVTLLRSPESLWTTYVAARVCYAKGGLDQIYEEDKTPEQIERWLEEKIISKGHLSLLEHLSFTFALKGCSRILSHQLVRSRIGVTFHQRSQRYIVEDDFGYIVPPSIYESDVQEATIPIFKNLIEKSKEAYKELISLGVPAEDARYLLPGACETQLVWTINGRALIETSKKRLCKCSQWSMRQIWQQVKEILLEECPLIARHMGPDCDLCTHKDCKRGVK